MGRWEFLKYKMRQLSVKYSKEKAAERNSKRISLENSVKGAVGSADLKISKSALLSLNHHNFSNTEPIYTE